MKLKKSKLLLLLAMLNLTACNNNNTKTIVYCLHKHIDGGAYPFTYIFSCCDGCKKIGSDDGSALEDYILNENKDGWFATECEKVDLECGVEHIHYLVTYSK